MAGTYIALSTSYIHQPPSPSSTTPNAASIIRAQCISFSSLNPKSKPARSHNQTFLKFKLENPPHQSTAIQSVVDVFRGMERNTYDNAHVEDIHSNVCSLSAQEITDNIQRISSKNGISANQAFIIGENDACIEMETGTGKTLTYIQISLRPIIFRLWC